jgi:hypothetical protein
MQGENPPSVTAVTDDTGVIGQTSGISAVIGETADNAASGARVVRTAASFSADPACMQNGRWTASQRVSCVPSSGIREVAEAAAVVS